MNAGLPGRVSVWRCVLLEMFSSGSVLVALFAQIMHHILLYMIIIIRSLSPRKNIVAFGSLDRNVISVFTGMNPVLKL